MGDAPIDIVGWPAAGEGRWLVGVATGIGRREGWLMFQIFIAYLFTLKYEPLLLYYNFYFK